MSSLSYCRFENTSADLQACLNDVNEALDKECDLEEFVASRSSEFEQRSVATLYHLCVEFVEAYENLEQI